MSRVNRENQINVWNAKYISDAKPINQRFGFLKRHNFSNESWNHISLKRMYNTGSMTLEKVWRMACFTLRWTSAIVFLVVAVVVIIRVISFFGFSPHTAAKSFWDFLKYLVWGS